MKTFALLSAPLLFLVFTGFASQTTADSGVLQQKLKNSVQQMVTDVKAEENPALKRQMLENFNPPAIDHVVLCLMSSASLAENCPAIQPRLTAESRPFPER